MNTFVSGCVCMSVFSLDEYNHTLLNRIEYDLVYAYAYILCSSINCVCVRVYVCKYGMVAATRYLFAIFCLWSRIW